MPLRVCGFEGCGRKHVARGWCAGHYRQVCVLGEAPVPLKKIAPRVEGGLDELLTARSAPRANGCIEWTAGRTTEGYGTLKVDGRARKAHRVSWENANGPIPEGMVIDHACGNRLCVNVEHLRPRTHSENCTYRVSLPANNKSGYLGVYATKTGRWRGHVTIRGERYWAPVLDSPEEVSEWLDNKRAEHFDVPTHSQWIQENANQKEIQ
jgi:hypothetical protein